MNKTPKYIGILVILVLIGGAYALTRHEPSPSKTQDYVSSDIQNIEAAHDTLVVELKNGDTYDMMATYVKKTIQGKEYKMLAYNGSIPGPLLKIPQGAAITVNFTNGLDMPTLLHSHGVRVNQAFDGAQTSQKEILPGETFSYTLTFPDAGMFWYHPHVREDFQQELGLYGNFLVVPKNTEYWSPVNREVSLFLDDILLENNRISLHKEAADHTLMGRFGNVMLVNGETSYALTVQKGEVVRFYFTNAANTRPFQVTIPGVKMKLVGADGGAYEKDEWVDAVTLGPSERVVVEMLFDASGTFPIEHKTPDKTYTLGQVTVRPDSVAKSYATSFQMLQTHTETAQSIEPFRAYVDKAPDKRLRLTIDMSGGTMSMSGMGHGGHMMQDGTMMGGMMMNASPDGIEWEDGTGAMNATANAARTRWKIVDEDTGLENMDIDWSFERGMPAKIRIVNDPHSMHPMQHPMHFHGQRFLVVARNGKKETNLVWKDTVFIPAGETVDVLLDTSNPGEWMAHCHIAEHLEAGMMLGFTVK